MSSFRVIRESRSAKDLRLRREDMEYKARHSDLRDTFHPPFTGSYGWPQGVQDRDILSDAEDKTVLSRLPNEIVDLIFSKLTPAALATARYTCRAWWTMIMGNGPVMISVLGSKPSKTLSAGLGYDSSEAKLRRMQREINRQMNTNTDHTQPRFWPLRFRKRVICFSLPEVCDHIHRDCSTSRPIFISADFAAVGRFMALLSCTFTTTSPIWEQNTISFYQLALSQEPLYVGSLECPRTTGLMRVIRGLETKSNRAWLITIDFDGVEKTYSIIIREAYARNDAPFFLEDSGTGCSPKNHPLGFNITTKISEELRNLEETWQVVTYLPSTMAKTSNFSRKQALAKHIASDTLWAVNVGFLSKAIDTAGDDQKYEVDLPEHHIDLNNHITAVALIIPPKEHWIFRNVAAAWSVDILRVAVVWQDIHGHFTTELHYHDIPSRIFYNKKRGGSSGQRQSYLQRLGKPLSASMLRELDSANLFANICGKRIHSLDPQMGGLHVSSPIKSLPEDVPLHTSNTKHQLGGLQISFSVRGSSGARIDSRKCFVWGVSASDDHHLSLVVFDFRYEGPMLPSPNYRSRGTLNWQRYPVNPPEYHFIHCACPLHDDGYNIVLPDTTCAALLARSNSRQQKEPQAPTSSNKVPYQLPEDYLLYSSNEYHRRANLFQKRSSALFAKQLPTKFYSLLWTKRAPPTPFPGSIEHYDPPARKEALERRNEELRALIRDWKREGLSDFDICERYFSSRCSAWGGIPKPDGWQKL